MDVVGSMRDGVLAQKHLLFGEDGSPNNYDLNVGLAGSGGWRTPRHRHNFDQIRYVLKGDYPYADKKVLPEGWIAYFPKSVHYGPQDRPEGLETMVLQFGDASGGGYARATRLPRALCRRGTGLLDGRRHGDVVTRPPLLRQRRRPDLVRRTALGGRGPSDRQRLLHLSGEARLYRVVWTGSRRGAGGGRRDQSRDREDRRYAGMVSQ